MIAMRRLALGMALAFGLGLAGPACIVHMHRRAGGRCGPGKVWVKRGHKWKCKKTKRRRRRERRHHIEKRDHRD